METFTVLGNFYTASQLKEKENNNLPDQIETPTDGSLNCFTNFTPFASFNSFNNKNNNGSITPVAMKMNPSQILTPISNDIDNDFDFRYNNAHNDDVTTPKAIQLVESSKNRRRGRPPKSLKQNVIIKQAVSIKRKADNDTIRKLFNLIIIVKVKQLFQIV
jgi:hypothetical protein